MKPRRRARLLAPLAAVTSAALLTIAGTASGAASYAKLSPVDGDVAVHVVAPHSRAVVFTLGGRPLGLRQAPFPLVVPGMRKAAPRRRNGIVSLVARDAQTHRLLAGIRLARAAAPTVTITGTPANPTSETTAAFTFALTGTKGAQCKLDAASFSTCTSPKAYSGLSRTTHTFTVRVDHGTARASATWTITGLPPSPTPPPPPPPPAPATGALVAPPVPPSPYTVPAGAVAVSTSAELLSALGASNPTDIVLADGSYDSAGPFWNSYGHRLYAANLGRAVLKAGLVFGNNWGGGNGLVRGVTFDVSDPAKTLQNSIIHVWGTGAGTRVLDVSMDGHRILGAGVMVRQPEGFVGQRIVARNFLDWGVIVDANVLGLAVATPPLLEDIVSTDVTHVVPQSSGGRSEACVWVGNTAIVRRVYTARCAWEGIWTGTAARNALFESIRVEESETGVYAEHYNSAGTTFRFLSIGSTVKRGVNCEWADPVWASIPGCIDVVIEDSLFETSVIGVYLDEGTTRTTIRRCTFRNQRWAAISDYKGIGNAYSNNDYSGVAAGGVAVSNLHLFDGWR